MLKINIMKLILILVSIFSLITFNNGIVYAEDYRIIIDEFASYQEENKAGLYEDNEDREDNKGSNYGDIQVDLFEPTITIEDSENPGETSGVILIIAKLLNFLTILGAVVSVICITLIGFGAILGSASDKAIAQEKIIGIFIGAILITSVSAIAKFIISFAETI